MLQLLHKETRKDSHHHQKIEKTLLHTKTVAVAACHKEAHHQQEKKKGIQHHPLVIRTKILCLIKIIKVVAVDFLIRKKMVSKRVALVQAIERPVLHQLHCHHLHPMDRKAVVHFIKVATETFMVLA